MHVARCGGNDRLVMVVVDLQDCSGHRVWGKRRWTGTSAHPLVRYVHQWSGWGAYVCAACCHHLAQLQVQNVETFIVNRESCRGRKSSALGIRNNLAASHSLARLCLDLPCVYGTKVLCPFSPMTLKCLEVCAPIHVP